MSVIIVGSPTPLEVGVVDKVTHHHNGQYAVARGRVVRASTEEAYIEFAIETYKHELQPCDIVSRLQLHAHYYEVLVD